MVNKNKFIYGEKLNFYTFFLNNNLFKNIPFTKGFGLTWFFFFKNLGFYENQNFMFFHYLYIKEFNEVFKLKNFYNPIVVESKNFFIKKILYLNPTKIINFIYF